MIRRLKKDVLSQLPDKRRQKIEVQTDPKKLAEMQKVLAGEQHGLNGDAEQTMKDMLSDDYQEKSSEGLGSFMKAYRLTGEAKV